MKQKLFYITILIVLCSYINKISAQSDRIMTLFVKEYPEMGNTKDLQTNRLTCQILKSHFKVECSSLDFSSNYGIFATYAGYLTISDINGEISFPRQTQKDSINLLITNKIYPIFMLRNTIAYWVLTDSAAKMYEIIRGQDQESGLFYWDVKEKELPKNNRIPIHTIIIINNPNDIYVPIGITPTNFNPQFILPTIYSKKDIHKLHNALFVMTIKQFFSQIKKRYKENPFGYDSFIII